MDGECQRWVVVVVSWRRTRRNGVGVGFGVGVSVGGRIRRMGEDVSDGRAPSQTLTVPPREIHLIRRIGRETRVRLGQQARHGIIPRPVLDPFRP